MCLVLLVSGELDPVTPPWLAQLVAKTLSRSRLVIAPNATHNSYECIENMVADFIDKGTTEGLDISCVEKIRRPPFNVLITLRRRGPKKFGFLMRPIASLREKYLLGGAWHTLRHALWHRRLGRC